GGPEAPQPERRAACLLWSPAAKDRLLLHSHAGIAMTDFAAARRNMVDGQIRTADVTDKRLIGAMLDLPRERFVPPEMVALAYLDLDLSLGKTARMLKPMVL